MADAFRSDAPRPIDAFDEFVATVAALRAPDGGCPWNCAQTHRSIGDYMIEEAYEALAAIEEGDVDHLREELGDVLLQVVLHSQIAADAGEFSIDDVCRDINQKMARRHPHVFGDVKAENANEVADLWEQVKLAEKAEKKQATAHGDADAPGLLDDVPRHFPALLQAQKISRKAAAAGFEWATVDDVWQKVAEERRELQEAYDDAPKTADGRMVLEGDGASVAIDPRVAAAQMEFGDLLFSLVNVGRKMGIDAEAALRASNEKFRRRFALIEAAAASQGCAVEDFSLEQMEACWNQAKDKEGEQR